MGATSKKRRWLRRNLRRSNSRRSSTTALLLKKAQNQPVAESHTFAIVAADLFKDDQGRVDRGERKQSLVDDAKYIYEADVQKFFYRHHGKDISYQRLVDYVAYLKKSPEESGKPAVSSKTIKNHFILISKIFKHAFKLGYIDKTPVFPTFTAQDNPRVVHAASV